MSGALPQLMDAKAVAAELGVTRAAALAFMRKLPKIQVDGVRKVYVDRADLAELLTRSKSS